MSPQPPAPEQPPAPASVPRSLRVSAPLARVRGATVDLTLLAPDLQEALLFGEADGLSEHRLRGVVAAGEWATQRVRFRTSCSVYRGAG